MIDWLEWSAIKIRSIILFVIIISLFFGLSFSKTTSKKFIYSENKPNVFSTYNWFEYHSENKIVKYSFEYPSNWSFNSSSVFTDQNGQKIAELLPGVVILKKNQRLLQVIEGGPSNYHQDEDEVPRPVLISNQSIDFARYKGIRVVKSVVATDGRGTFIEWYPITYYLQDKNRVFIINFYERELNSDLRKIFDDVVKSFKFID